MRKTTMLTATLLASLLLCAGGQADKTPAVKTPYWLAPMAKVHAGFRGSAGYVAQLGDSITYSMAFWAPMGWSDPAPYLTDDDGLAKTPKPKRWRDVIRGIRDKGAQHGNYSGWTVGQVLKSTDRVLASKKPEVAVIMVGTNDVAGGRVPKGYRNALERIVTKCLAAQCIPVLNTIPPRRGRMAAVREANKIVRELARKHNVPLVDYFAEILRLRPGKTWDGTLIGRDGVHPTAGKTNVYSEENLKISGYALRNWLNFRMFREVYFRVLTAKAGG